MSLKVLVKVGIPISCWTSTVSILTTSSIALVIFHLCFWANVDSKVHNASQFLKRLMRLRNLNSSLHRIFKEARATHLEWP